MKLKVEPYGAIGVSCQLTAQSVEPNSLILLSTESTRGAQPIGLVGWE